MRRAIVSCDGCSKEAAVDARTPLVPGWFSMHSQVTIDLPDVGRRLEIPFHVEACSLLCLARATEQATFAGIERALHQHGPAAEGAPS